MKTRKYINLISFCHHCSKIPDRTEKPSDKNTSPSACGYLIFLPSASHSILLEIHIVVFYKHHFHFLFSELSNISVPNYVSCIEKIQPSLQTSLSFFLKGLGGNRSKHNIKALEHMSVHFPPSK